MEKTNLNVSPYYDDFAEDKNFQRILFRPGFSVQSRELTQLQTILQNQIERHGRHMFKEGSVVIPGAIGFTNEYYAVRLESILESTEISSYIQDYVGKRITGSTSGVVAEVIQAVAATTDDPITLFVKYISTGDDNETIVFQDGERIFADGTVGSFGEGVDSSQLIAQSATATGSSANIQEGVYFIRGHFVRVAEQRIILDKYTNSPSYRVGLTITETLETPEEDTSLLDNAQGSSNVNAKGAHRLKMELTLDKLALDSEEDENFIELLRISEGVVQEKARNTEYSVLGETFARRTYDESGDYTVRDFDVDILENLDDGLNNGVYQAGETTDSGNTASDDFLTIQVSPGKAYVRGYEIETIAPKYIDVAKPRTFETYNEAATPVEVGNYVIVDNVHGQPEISPEISGEIDEPYREVELYDTATTSRGAVPSGGNKIGVARVRAMEHHSGNDGTSDDLLADGSTTDTKFKVYLFDLRMFTEITLSGTPASGAAGGVVTGAKITGQDSGAYGFVHSDSSGTKLVLTSVVGSFSTGEKLASTSSTVSDELVENSSNTDLTISTINPLDFSSVKQVFMNDPNVADTDFSADLVLDAEFQISGLVSNNGSNATLNGFQTNFTGELRDGDIIALPSGASGALEEFTVTVTDDTTLTLSGTPTNATTSVQATRKRSKLTDQNKNVMLRKLQKRSIKSLKTDSNDGISETSLIVRKSFIAESDSSGQVTFTAGSNETFQSVENEDYVLTVIAAGSGSASDGDIINLNSSNVTVSAPTNQLTITSASLLGNSADVRLIATLRRAVVNEKNKTRNRMNLTLVENDGVAGGAEYGTSAHHKEVSIGFADVHKLWAVFESEDSSTNPTLPQWTTTGASGTFTKGEIINGATSGAKARVINPISPITYVPLNDVAFTTGEVITGLESGETATLDTFTDGSRVITSNYTLDTGQRDNFYDVGRIIRKPSAVSPVGKLLVVYDYFEHGTGDFFTVDSYSSIDYKEIPTYSATRVDPEVAEPTGEYDLRDAVDFRPRVADATTSNQSLQAQTVYTVTDFSMNFESRSYTGTGSSTINIPKDGSNFSYDFEYYVPRRDSIFLTANGEFKVVSGAPSEIPETPKPVDDAMLIADLSIPAYVVDIADVNYTLENNRRYTMRDIGKLESRIENMEYYTALNLLEKDAASLQVQDSNGLDRFKSGFLVDNFAGHATGDVQHPDYRVSIDMQNGELRPKYYMKNIEMIEENGTETERTNNNYQKTGSLLTLPYEHAVTAEQPYATRVENLNPVLTFSWAGNLILTPEGDEWFEVNRLPDLIINREGNFDSVLAANRNAIGTVWNAWQTQWSGVTRRSTRRFRDTSFTSAASRSVPGRAVIRRTTTTRRTVQTRSGIRTSVVPRIDMESRGERIVSRAVIPFIRARNVFFKATGMKPLTKVYPFFDKKNVSAYCWPTGGGLSGKIVERIVNAQGSWTSISRIEFDYWKRGGNPLIFTASYRTMTRGRYVQIATNTYPGSTKSTLVFDGLNLTPNNAGHVGIRGYATDTNDRIGANDRLYDIRVYDQNGNLIPRNLYQLESQKKWTRVHRALDSNTKSYATFLHAKYANKNKQNEITIRVLDGAKTIVPTGSRIKLLDNTSVDERALVTDAAGTVEGYFAIPDPNRRGSPRFRTGERLFRLTSSSTNVETPEPETFAQAIYTANGTLNTVRETIIATRNGRVVTRSVSDTRSRTRTRTRDAVVGWWDPLAQSFMPQAEGGEYITKVDVYFQGKDDDLPVTCQIREMENGYPTTKVLPFGSVTKEPEDVDISDDASAATTFTFEEPVYVKNGVEHCIVLQTDSAKYLAWISRMGEQDVGGKRLVSEQPYLGVLFKSQNNSTWSAYDMEDLKFKLYRAKFDTTATGTVTFINEELPTKILETDAIRTFNGESLIKVSHENHHMYTSSNNVTISGVSSGVATTLDGAITDTATSLTLTSSTGWPSSGTVYAKITSYDDDGDAVTEVVSGTISGTTISSLTRGVEGTAADHEDDVAIEWYQLNGIPLTEINKTHTSLANIGIDSYTVSTSTSATADGVAGGSAIEATENAMIDQMQTLFSTIEHPSTGLTTKVRMTSATSPSGNQTSFSKQTLSQAESVPLNDNYIFSNPKMVASNINETNEMSGENSIEVIMTIQSEVDNLSPVIDLDKRSIVGVANRLNNIDSSADVYPTDEYVPATDPEGDTNETVYVTRKVQLKTPGTAIKCFLDAAKFESAEIQVMYKILRSDDASDFDEIGWLYFNNDGSPDTTVNASVNEDDFIEREYTVDGLEEFIAFAIKIRMQGTNSSEPPRVKDLRAIALAT